MPNETVTTAFKQAVIGASCLTIFAAVVGIAPATGAYEGFPLNSYWYGVGGIDAFLLIVIPGLRYLLRNNA